ncbi:Fumarate reductase flavoprotein subunit [Zhongshania aliphaticivorans]|uniref:Fumarate reductase flavoprotein subunit n=1 Tax=Zhongshania aliphaticivorans TaxID=1470434 RepID=A0A5S9MZ64_9GAMM|nr:FAD-dependent oxidoreductase [Zhongshania aliphaticivorans]CAA0082700.1 Fumarate reductase flavoprotein subunit [Zhongshania aliphaticivorans]CAA0084017.1 Fumarate reductase flavoprotein subunit [Zhongshania aliphaticivorans]
MATDKTAATKPRNSKDITHWDIETDVAIIGFGGAGASAAIEAADAGSKVCIFELASASGGSTALSSAEIYMGGNGGTPVQQACGYHDDTQNMVNYLKACFGNQADDEKIGHYCENSVGHYHWLTGLGVPFKLSELKERAIMALTDDCLLFTGNEKAHPFTEHASPVPRGHNLQVEGDNGGPLLMKILTEAVEQRGVDIHYDSRALSLIVNDNGEVEGVIVRIDQQEKCIRARKGVILCAGGFCMNEEMLKKYAPTFDCGLIPIGNSGDTGSGILMGMGVGAGTTNMHECFVSLPYYPPSSLTYGILINDKAQRFINEDCYHGRVGYNALIAQRNSSRIYFITDLEGYGDYEKMSYLGATVAGTGDTIAELEQELALPESSLQHTLETYNRHAASGEDPYFHKSEAWLRPLTPPFVALDCTLGRGTFYPFFTLGGLDTTVDGQVLTPERNIIKGLFAAGRTTAGIPRTASGYASGMSVGDVTYFGRLAGKSAAGN